MSCHQSLERFLGRQIKVLNHAFGRRIREESSARGLDELTIMHGRILGYLKYNQDRDVFQKDIEEAFNITRSSVTGVVKLMEQKGYIRRESVAGDARLKKLCLTQLGDQVCERSFQVIPGRGNAGRPGPHSRTRSRPSSLSANASAANLLPQRRVPMVKTT